MYFYATWRPSMAVHDTTLRSSLIEETILVPAAISGAPPIETLVKKIREWTQYKAHIFELSPDVTLA